MKRLFAPPLLIALASLAPYACGANSGSLECQHRSDCEDPTRPICVQSSESDCRPGTRATNTQCVPGEGCVCRVGDDPGQPLLDLRGLVEGMVCIDPAPRDSGVVVTPLVCYNREQCEGVDEFCVQVVNEPCVYGEAPFETKCQPRSTPGCHCYVGIDPNLLHDVPGRIVSDPCPSSLDDGGLRLDGD